MNHAPLRSAISLGALVIAGCANEVQVEVGASVGPSSTSTSTSTSTSAAASGGQGGGGAGGPTGGGGADATSGTGGMGSTSGSAGGGSGEGPGDLLDATQIYLLGTLQEGACYRDALSTLSNPNAATVGFDCYFDNDRAMIRPTDGRLIYTNVFEDLVREFHCDDCTYAGDYPPDPLANDTVLPTLPCAPDGGYSLSFQVAPSGYILHTCTANPLLWYDEAGAIAYSDAGDKLLHLGYGTQALTLNRIVDLATMSSVTLSGLPYDPILTVRALPPDGFWVVLAAGGPGPVAGEELWAIDATGVATLVGAYPPPPAGYNVDTGSARLDSTGALFEIGHDSNAFLDVVFRRAVNGPSEIVYSEATNPLVQIHISALLTGP